ncbi:MAG: aminotransferase class IV [Gammaproteobacteria bacterium]|nr:aminotransferase class IV [Gammaproteobacteria bacterium]
MNFWYSNGRAIDSISADDRAAHRDGVRARICNTRLALQPQLAGIKTLNRLEQVLARAEWDHPAIFEGLMRDTGDRLICGTMSNVFIVSAQAIATPAITRCGVTGIMRRHLLLFDNAGIHCDVRDIRASELSAADEVFVANSQFGVLPVMSCDGRKWPVGDITRQAMMLAGQNDVTENIL